LGTTHYKKSNIEFDKTVNIKTAGYLQYNSVAITATAAELNILSGVTATAAEINGIDGIPLSVSMSTTAALDEAGDKIVLPIQLQDLNSVDLAVRGSVLAYCSTDANGDSRTTAVTLSTSGDGLVLQLEADKVYQLISESDGDIDLTLETTAAAAYYVNLVLPNGKIQSTTGALTFT